MNRPKNHNQVKNKKSCSTATPFFHSCHAKHAQDLDNLLYYEAPEDV